MWWKTVLKIAVALGLDKWAKRKAGKIVKKIRNKAKKKVEDLQKAVEKI
jgi:hypothetical protein